MKRTISLLMLIFLLSACGPVSENDTIVTCRSTLDAISSLTGGLEIPENFRSENPVKTGGDFDVMQYFSKLDHLSIQPGYVLDYVYHYDGMGGFPVLYVRPAGIPPFRTESDLSTSDGLTNYMDYVQVDDTPESYFQFVILSRLANQFYLFWHANYGETQTVCEKADVGQIVAGLNGDFGYRMSLVARIRSALMQDIDPTVIVDEDSVEVKFVIFTRWGGFYRQTYTIGRSMPHIIEDVQEQNLVPYDCGVMF